MNVETNELLKKLKKPEAIEIIRNYYTTIGREQIPPIENYTLDELKKCIHLFGIQLTYKTEK